MGKAKILIIEDEKRLAEILRKQLEEAGFEPSVAGDGYLGSRMVRNEKYDLVILDINLPLMNGYEVCKEIRKTNQGLPVIMLTALGTTDNKLAGFDVGADDYVLKPFDSRELIARIHVFLRRKEVELIPETLRIADLELDLNNKTVKRGDRRIELTSREYALLELFVKNKGELLSREFIIEQVWGIDFDPGTNIIDVYVNYLRKKVDKGFDLKLIHTKYGFGFYCSEKEI